MSGGIIPPNQVGPQEAATAGVIIALLLQGNLGWRRALAIVASGEVFAYFLTLPAAHWLGAGVIWYGPFGLFFGFAGMYLAGALMKVLQDFQEEPLSVLKRVFRIFHGGDDK